VTSHDGATFDTLLRAVAASPEVRLLEREVLGQRFRLRRRLGDGGFGVVYEAEDLRDGGTVALKLLRRAEPTWLYRFKREFRALQGIAHPNLVVLDELFGDDDRWYFTMELVEGVDFVEYASAVSSSPSPVRPFESTARAPSGELERADVALAFADAALGVRQFDEVKLRESLRQLLEGLSILHALGKVHRDIKPSNVLVTPAGRVVIIDFGLVANSLHVTDSATIGTPVYMAPEQAAARELGPPADLYAVGVMLYQLLTGHLPIRGSGLQVLIDKQTHTPVPPAALVADVPADLNALCMLLLRVDPAQRPSTAEVCRMLQAASPVVRSQVPTGHEDTPFVGRGAELRALHDAFATSSTGQLSVVLVRGESGIGKTKLLRQFARQISAKHPAALWLEGRCHEREAIPYKTIDGIVETLSRRLAHMSETEVAALLPTRRGLLARVFPALLRIPQLAKQDVRAPGAASTDVELRQRAFLELRELFTRVAMQRPTVIFIDDLQWADDDGLLALAEILETPDAPPLLFVGALRDSGGAQALPTRLGRIAAGAQLLDLHMLEDDQARELTAALLPHTGAITSPAERIVREAGGHPLFIEELVRHVAAGPLHGELSLDNFIWSRVLQLEAAARAVVELVAVAGKPLPQAVVASAALLEPGAFRTHAAVLRTCNLVRTSGVAWADTIGSYHDRIREVVLARLDAERCRQLHRKLAVAYETAQPIDLEALALHWTEAGERARAVVYATAAGDQAARAFAFDRAAAWFEQSLALLPETDGARRGLHVKCGDVLLFAGRGALAAKHFELAAADAVPSEALELRRLAAEQYLLSGHFDRGIEASGVVLRSIGMRLPTGRLRTLVALLYYAVRLRLRGLAFRERAPAELTAHEQTRIDTCFSMATALSLVEPVVGYVFQTRALLLALSSGELERVVRSLAMHAAYSALYGQRSWRRTSRLIELTRSTAERSGSVRARVSRLGMTGIALFNNGRFREASEQVRDTLELLEDSSLGLVFERFTARLFMIQLMGLRGSYKELSAFQRAGLHEAVLQQNVYAMVNLRIGFANLTWLLEDRPFFAELQIQEAMQQWSQRGFHLEHFYALVARVSIKLYQGEHAEAYAIAGELLVACTRSLLWRVQTLRFRVLYSHGGACLSMLERGLGDRARLLREVRRAARGIGRERASWMRPFVDVLHAGVALHEGSPDAAHATLRAASRGFTAHDISGFAAAARDRAARLRADASSEVEIAEVAQQLKDEGVVAPERLIGMLIPGLLTRAR
jgi:eukaryotic-like serine/threonine-protein kinase